MVNSEYDKYKFKENYTIITTIILIYPIIIFMGLIGQFIGNMNNKNQCNMGLYIDEKIPLCNCNILSYSDILNNCPRKGILIVLTQILILTLGILLQFILYISIIACINCKKNIKIPEIIEEELISKRDSIININ